LALAEVRSNNRIPPHNIDAEQSVLGAMLESKEAIANVIDILDSDDFYKPAHSAIYDAIVDLYGRGDAADAITVAEELARTGKLDFIGGRPYILGLIDAYPTASSAKHYARIVEEHALLRRLISAGNEIQEIGFSLPESVDDAVDSAEEIIYSVGDRRLRDDIQPIRPLLTKSMLDIEALYDRGESVTGLASGFPDLDEMTSGFQQSNLIILAARPAMGKCLPSFTRLDDPLTGERITIEELVKERRSTVSGVAQDGRVRPTEVSDWIPNGTKQCFEVRTKTGRKITATANHPFLTVDGWVPLEELRAGDRVAVPRKLDVFGKNREWTGSRARLLAYFIAEGGLTGRSPIFTNADPEIVEDFKKGVCEFEDCSVTGPVRYGYRARGRNKGATNPITTWLRDLGMMGKRAEEKYFPDCVWTFTKPVLSEFLRALFSCDGTIYPMSGYPRIEFTVASERLAEDVHHALVRFGIVSKLWRKTERSWRVEITDPASVEIYQNEIGWIGEKTRRRFLELRTRRPHSNSGHVPKEAWAYVRKALEAKGMSLAELGRRAGEKGWSNLHCDRSIPQRRMAVYAEILDSDDLRWLASPDLYWDEIVSVTPVGEREVYDLTVPDGSNFIAEDFCVHNSSMLNDFALNVAMRQNVPVVIFSLEMSRHEIVKRFLASESRVDAQRLNKGSLQEQDWTRLSSALGRLAETPIFIDDSANITLMEMRAKCRRLKAKHGLGLVIIDYLQLMQSPRKSENRQQEVSEISRSLKILAKELSIPVICASQLNRGVEYRSDKRPFLGDLRESGCLTADTRIARADTGQWVTMGELYKTRERDIPVWTVNEDLKIERGTMTHVFSSGVKKVYKLKLRSGREIKASANHPFLSYDGWKRVDELQMGERLAVPRNLPEPSKTTEWPDSHVILLAHMIGDGSCLKRLPTRYASMSMENLQAVADAATAFGVTAHVKFEPAARSYQLFMPSPYQVTHGRRNPIVAWMDSLGLYDKRSHEKFVPREVFELPQRQIALFLRHLWATDGHVSVRTSKLGRQPSVYYASNSRQLAEDVCFLLLRLGVFSRITTTGKIGYRDMHQVQVGAGEHLQAFVREVGAFGPKMHGLNDLNRYLETSNSKAHRDTIPADVWQRLIVLQGTKSVSAVTAGAGVKFRSQMEKWASPSRQVIAKLGDFFGDEELLSLAHSDLFWDILDHVEYVGEEEVFDATVQGTHNFLADGIVVENSIEQDSDMVMFIYRDEVYNPDSPNKGEAELIVAKHRNGPTGTVRLAFMNQYTKFASIAKGPGI
jgi:replicative DNA helicase